MPTYYFQGAAAMDGFVRDILTSWKLEKFTHRFARKLSIHIFVLIQSVYLHVFTVVAMQRIVCLYYKNTRDVNNKHN